MKKYLVAAVLIAAFSTPVLAVETFYIMFDNTMKGCSITTTETKGQKMMGKYNSMAEAETAMKSMKECG
jgi:enoyl-[acyl-carrier-protein] reductase (NADH)